MASDLIAGEFDKMKLKMLYILDKFRLFSYSVLIIPTMYNYLSELSVFLFLSVKWNNHALEKTIKFNERNNNKKILKLFVN